MDTEPPTPPSEPASIGPLGAIGYMFLYLLAMIVGQVVGTLAFRSVLPEQDALAVAFLVGSVFAAAVIIGTLKQRGLIRSAGLIPVERRVLLMGAVAGVLLFGASMLLYLIIGEEVEQDLLGILVGSGPVGRGALILAVVLAVPIVEEILIRGLLFGALLARIGPIWAVLGSSAAFVIPHALGAAFGLLMVAQLTTVALVTAVMRLRTGSVYPSAVAHSIYNAIVTVSVIQELG